MTWEDLFALYKNSQNKHVQQIKCKYTKDLWRKSFYGSFLVCGTAYPSYGPYDLYALYSVLCAVVVYPGQPLIPFCKEGRDDLSLNGVLLETPSDEIIIFVCVIQLYS